MSPAHTRRSGLAWHGLWPAGGQTHLRFLAVVGLIVGVVAMHSLGLGHGPMSAGHSMSAGTTQMAGMGASSEAHATTSVVADVGAVVGVDPSHQMAAMCLAVLPFLVLLIARMLGFRIRGLGSAARLLPAWGNVRSDRAPPAYRCPSLLKLCILRT
ncbi:DUF6153 family protein [Dermatophilaceae bacterium Soc4.6]